MFQFLNFVCQSEFQLPGGGLLFIEFLFQAGFEGLKLLFEPGFDDLKLLFELGLDSLKFVFEDEFQFLKEALIESFGFFLLLTLATPTLTLPLQGEGNQAASYGLELYHPLIPVYIPFPLQEEGQGGGQVW